MTVEDRLSELCPKHKHKKKDRQRWFRCICRELEIAWQMGEDS